jgi:hypothetical protein
MFTAKVLFTDESHFTRTGITKIHNGVVRWKSSYDLMSPPAKTVFCQLVGWKVTRLPHSTSYFTVMSCWSWLPLFSLHTLKWTTGRCVLQCVIACGFNTIVLHHIMVMKCVNSCPKIALNAGLIDDMKLQFPGLHIHWLESSQFFLWEYFTTKVSDSTVDSRELCHWIEQIASGVKNTPGIFECQFLFHAELGCVSVKMLTILSNSCMRVKIKTLLIALFICFIFIHNTLNLLSI